MSKSSFQVAVTDFTFGDLAIEKSVVEAAGGTLVSGQCKSEKELAKLAAGADAVIVQFAPCRKEAIEGLKKAKVIVRYGIGVDNVDLSFARSKKIPVCNVPDYCWNEVADHTLAMILGLTRGVVANAEVCRQGLWKLGVGLADMRCLADMQVGVVGFGRIGRGVAARLNSFGCTVKVYDPLAPETVIRKAGFSSCSLPALLKSSDLVTLHCPSLDSTRGMLDQKAFATMKEGALLVNTSRGDLVVTEDLIEALKSGCLAGAALDVTHPEPPPKDSPLRCLPNVILHSHVASASAAAVRRLRETASRLAVDGALGRTLVNVVNLGS
jgi:D-3-phosphoglycerate dehydrogenase